MSDDITKWMDDIREGTWTAFGKSSKDIMDTWGFIMATSLRTGGSAYPVSKLGQRSGRLGDALMGIKDSEDDGRQEDNVIVYQRTIKVPYADISDKGGDVKITERMRGYLLAQYMDTKDKKYAYMAFSKDGMLHHKAFNYAQEATNKIDSSIIAEKVMPHVINELNKIPNLEVTIGNK